MSLVDSALALATKGKPIFPVARNWEKKPLVKWKPFQDRAPSREEVKRWWTEWPDANIGLATGHLSELMVVDTDSQEATRAFIENYPEAEKTLQSQTGRDGARHFYFVFEQGITNDAGKLLGLGIDVRGEGGFVVIPQSVHANGRRYEWINRNEPITLPSKLREKLLSRSRSAPQNGHEKSEIKERIPEGQRNASLTSLGGTMRRRGMSESAILAALKEENTTKCDPPLSDSEVDSIAHSVARYEPAQQSEEAKNQKRENEPTPELENVRIKIETLADLWRKDIPKRESFLGDGLIARGDLIVFSGPQKKGKSVASTNQALCLARGESWLGFAVPKPIRVGIIQQEIPEGAMKDRLEKMLGPDAGDPYFLSSIPHCSRQGLKLDNKEGLDFLRAWLDKAKVDLLQLDPLYTFHRGDENSAKDMGRFFTSLQEINREYGLAILVIHHHGKPSQVEREGGDLHRGSSLLRDVSDANWTFTRIPANKLSLAELPSKYVYLGFEQRHCHSPDPLLLHMDEETLWFERVEAKEVQEVRAEEVVEEIVQRGGKALQEELIKALHEKLDARDRSTRDAIYKARDEGLIEGFFKGHKRAWKLSVEAGKDVGEEPCQSAI